MSIGVAERELLELQAILNSSVGTELHLTSSLYHLLHLLHSKHRPDEDNKSRKPLGPRVLSYSVA